MSVLEGQEVDPGELYKPLFLLKSELINTLGFFDEHPYRIFCTWRFANSIRQNPVFV